MIKIALIAISKINYLNDVLYSYEIPENMCENLNPGQRVVVPFGNSNFKRQGMVMEVSTLAESATNLKSIRSVLDSAPVVSKEMLGIIKWIKESCFCTYYDAINAVIPKEIGGKIKSVTYFLAEPKEDLSGEEKAFLSEVSSLDSFCPNDLKNFKIKNYTKVLNSLIQKGAVIEKVNISKSTKEKKQDLLSVNPDFSAGDKKLSKKQAEVFESLKGKSPMTAKEICELTGASRCVLNSLVEKNAVLKVCETSVVHSRSVETKLNPEQENVFEKMLELYKKGQFSVSLLHGVTGSGKTHVILKLIDEVLASGKSVIFLVPEIALTMQFIEIFSSRYKEKLAVIHSGVAGSQKVKAWEKIKSGEVSIVIGARSAIFAPFENLGLVVIDEEHEFTYKSESAPRFDARQVAKCRCKFHGCMMVLSSATPSLESYYMAKTGRYNLFKLKNRYKNLSLPQTQIVDISGRFSSEGQVLFSAELIDAVEKTIKNGNQAIILLNRRGFNTFVKCQACGEVQMCPHCSVSLNYHKSDEKLLCHYCGYSRSILEKCLLCGEKRLSYLGFGTQRAEFQLQELLPEARILRLDSDTKLSDKQEIIKDFENGKYDVLIGTQMVSKGFNFPNVTLVGILMADQYLYSGDFRGSEKTFSLITQTIGRAGRYTPGGKAIIQTFSPENSVLNFAASQDYEAFYEEEIALRKLMLTPPFADICLVSFKAVNKNLAFDACKTFFEKLVFLSKEKYGDLPLRIFPPASASIEKVANHYRFKIIIKCRSTRRFRNMINEAMMSFKPLKEFKNVSIIADINPLAIL